MSMPPSERNLPVPVERRSQFDSVGLRKRQAAVLGVPVPEQGTRQKHPRELGLTPLELPDISNFFPTETDLKSLDRREKLDDTWKQIDTVPKEDVVGRTYIVRGLLEIGDDRQARLRTIPYPGEIPHVLNVGEIDNDEAVQTIHEHAGIQTAWAVRIDGVTRRFEGNERDEENSSEYAVSLCPEGMVPPLNPTSVSGFPDYAVVGVDGTITQLNLNKDELVIAVGGGNTISVQTRHGEPPKILDSSHRDQGPVQVNDRVRVTAIMAGGKPHLGNNPAVAVVLAQAAFERDTQLRQDIAEKTQELIAALGIRSDVSKSQKYAIARRHFAELRTLPLTRREAARVAECLPLFGELIPESKREDPKKIIDQSEMPYHTNTETRDKNTAAVDSYFMQWQRHNQDLQSEPVLLEALTWSQAGQRLLQIAAEGSTINGEQPPITAVLQIASKTGEETFKTFVDAIVDAGISHLGQVGQGDQTTAAVHVLREVAPILATQDTPDATRKITDIIHAGMLLRYGEKQQEVEGIDGLIDGGFEALHNAVWGDKSNPENTSVLLEVRDRLRLSQQVLSPESAAAGHAQEIIKLLARVESAAREAQAEGYRAGYAKGAASVEPPVASSESTAPPKWFS